MLHSDDPDVSSGPEITGVHHGCDDGSNEVAAVETTAGVAASSPNEKSNELAGHIVDSAGERIMLSVGYGECLSQGHAVFPIA